MRNEKLSYRDHVRRLLASDAFTSDEVVLAHQILAFPDPGEIGWMTYRLLERLTVRGALRRLDWQAGEPQTDVRYLDPSTNDSWVVHLPHPRVGDAPSDRSGPPPEAVAASPEATSRELSPGRPPMARELLHTLIGSTATNRTPEELENALQPLRQELVARTSATEVSFYLRSEETALVPIIASRVKPAPHSFFEKQVHEEVLEAGKMLAVSNPDPARAPDLPGALAFVPLVSGTQRIGFLEIVRSEPGAFPDEEIDLFAFAAASAAEIVVRAGFLEKLIYIDSLTGLYNRAYFEDHIRREIARVDRVNRDQGDGQERLGLLVADLDQLKNVNDTHGHPAGDEVLRAVGRIIDSGIRQIDVAARIGGDEFAILLPRTLSRETLRFTANRLRELVANARIGPPIPELGATGLTVSIGFALYPDDTDPSERQPEKSLVYRADKALLEAKDQGRNRVVAWREITSR